MIELKTREDGRSFIFYAYVRLLLTVDVGKFPTKVSNWRAVLLQIHLSLSECEIDHLLA